jgi:muramoyltetrapeptide carboxypeptidase
MTRAMGWLTPPPVNQGESVALIAPAGPPPVADTIDKAVARFEALGMKVVLGKNVRRRFGYLAGTDAERLHDLRWALATKKVRAIVCVRGGYGLTRILPRLNLRAMRSDPKLVIGFSDITALHAALSNARIASVHGPMPNALVEDGFPPFATQALVQALTQRIDMPRSLLAHYETPETVRVIRRGRAEGRLVGGNLAMLCSLIGTPYFPDLSGKILALEEIGEQPFRIDRMLTHLMMVGALKRVRGIALGVFKNCDPRPQPGVTEFRQTVLDVLSDRLTPLRVPVVYGLPFGHVADNGALPLGVSATLIAGASGDLLIGPSSARRKRG